MYININLKWIYGKTVFNKYKAKLWMKYKSWPQTYQNSVVSQHGQCNGHILPRDTAPSIQSVKEGMCPE